MLDQTVRVVGETFKRFVIMADAPIALPGLDCILKPGERALVSKRSITFKG